MTSRIFCSLTPIVVVGLLLGSSDAGEATSTVRFATFNVSLNRDSSGQLLSDLKSNDKQAEKVAQIIRRVRPDVLLLNEFDFDSVGASLEVFCEKYLETKDGVGKPIHFEYRFIAPVNTGCPSGLDLNNNGKRDEPADAFGFGRHSGQYGMAVLSRLPILKSRVRTFQKFRWIDMPKAKWPRNPDGSEYYSAAVQSKFRLSSKSHWDVPIQHGNEVIHFLVSHPTPPAFDGPEDRNGCRNHDEIRFWRDYVLPKESSYIYDDRGQQGGLGADAPFVIAGDLNADPKDGGSVEGSISQLLTHSKIAAFPAPTGDGNASASREQGGVNSQHTGPAEQDTADFSDRRVGNLRVDYVLPSHHFDIQAARVFWPKRGSQNAQWLSGSDHRMVFVDTRLVDRFSTRVTDQGIEIRERDRPALFYQKAVKRSPDGRYPRNNYVHPLYDLEGNILTEDFPKDHLHHRGVFWTWHQVRVGEKRLGDPWVCSRFEWKVEKLDAKLTRDFAELQLRVNWQSPDHKVGGLKQAVVQEDTTIRVWPSSDGTRRIDFAISLSPLVSGVSIGGSDDVKGYGGFSPRIKMPRDLVFTSSTGSVKPMGTAVKAGNWMDLTATFSGGNPSGITILDHPKNPGFPQPWILRQQGSMQNPVFPGRHPVDIAKGLTLRYRLVIHQGRRSIEQLQSWANEWHQQ